MDNFFEPVTVHDKVFGNPYVSRKRNPFNDKRLGPVWSTLKERMTTEQSAVVHQLGRTTAEMDSFYNFYNNPKVTTEELIKMNCGVKPESLEQAHVLVLGDSSSFTMSKKGRIRDMENFGVLNDGSTPGFNTHVNLVVDAKEETVLGLGDIMYWFRPKKAKTAKRMDHTKIPFEQKESYRWALGALNAQTITQQADLRTHVYDSESDYFGLMVYLHHELRDEFVIRSKHNRTVDWQGQSLKLSAVLSQVPPMGIQEIELRKLDHYSRTAGVRKKRVTRKANLEIKSTAITISGKSRLGFDNELPLYVVQAKEIVKEPLPEGESPVHWILFTTHPVTCLEEALEILRYYAARWIIEQFFRALKKKGFQIEATELTTSSAIVKQTTMAMKAACDTLQLVYAHKGTNEQVADQVFNEKEQQVLQKVNEHLQGNTEKKRIRFPQKV